MAKRKSIDIDGFKHSNPIPAASLLGNLLMSGLLSGKDPESGAMPESLDEQMDNAFGHIQAVVEAAGGTTDDIVKINVWLKDPARRSEVNRPWLEMFPDEDARPARHTHQLHAGGDALIHVDVTAVIG